MKLNDLILSSIYNYPSLYYKKSFKESHFAVIHHLFMVLGTGVDFTENEQGNNPRFVLNQSVKFPKGGEEETKEKILRGVPIYEILDISREMFACFTEEMLKTLNLGVYPDLNSPHEKLFEDEYISKGYDYPEFYKEDQSHKLNQGKGCFIYPENNDRRESPYPFSMWHLNFIEINPHYQKYTYATISNITVEELRESKDLIAADCVEAIVEIYQWALKFFSDKETYYADKYYNPKPDSEFENKIKEALKSPESTKTLCQNYNAEYKVYESVEQFISDLGENHRLRYVSNCEKIVAAFS